MYSVSYYCSMHFLCVNVYCTVLYSTVLYYCHRVSTQLQLTNLSTYEIILAVRRSFRYKKQPHEYF